MKLYIIVRADLSPGARAAQACHASNAFLFAHPEAARSWSRDSNNLVCLEIADEAALLALADKAAQLSIPYTLFHEPDFDNQATAVAMMSPQAKRLTSTLRLALRDAVDRAA